MHPPASCAQTMPLRHLIQMNVSNGHHSNHDSRASHTCDRILVPPYPAASWQVRQSWHSNLSKKWNQATGRRAPACATPRMVQMTDSAPDDMLCCIDEGEL